MSTEVDPWLVCPDDEFESYVEFLRSPESTLVEQTRKDGVDIEDVIIALRVARQVQRLEPTGTLH